MMEDKYRETLKLLNEMRDLDEVSRFLEYAACPDSHAIIEISVTLTGWNSFGYNAETCKAKISSRQLIPQLSEKFLEEINQYRKRLINYLLRKEKCSKNEGCGSI